MKHPPDWILALLLVAGVYLWQRTAFPPWMVDLLPIQLAAHQWGQGDIENMYAPVDRFDEWYKTYEPVARSLGGEGFGNPYFYPPFVAATLAPASSVHARVWRNVLFAANVCLIFLNAWFVLLLTGANRTLRNALWCVSLVLLCYPMSRAAKLGQIVPALAALTWAGLLWLRAEKDTLAGVLLGFVGAVKLFPIGFVALPVVMKRWKTVKSAALIFIAIFGVSLLVLGLRVHELFWAAVNEFRTLTYPYQGNQSLLGWFVRLVYDKSLVDIVPFSDARMETAKLAIIALIALPTIAWLVFFRRGYDKESFPAFAGLLLSGTLLALPTAWEHYWLWMLPVLGWALHEEWTHNESRFRLTWILIASIFFLTKLTRFYDETDVGRVFSGSQCVGMIMLWFWLLHRIRRTVRCTPLNMNS
ncbi:DUF2029 domain-containing protein [bacterium]|nr:DUF2029 domain-containing protein [bacterium]